ncbi:endolytic transglycosylase MltG, partial [Patescibacteria group bacterium]
HDGTLAVPPGSTAAQVVRRLTDDGQVRSVRWFRLLLRTAGVDRHLRTGMYRIDRGLSAWGIVRRLASGRSVTIKVTIPEGWTADKIADRLEAAGVCGRDAFLAAVSSAAAEGFLFPDTYDFDPYIPPERARDVMIGRFSSAWRAAVSSSTAVEMSTVSARLDRVRVGARWWTCAEVVTLASIVEREGGRAGERSSVAAVYHNRLKKRMRLEADPTVQYALGRWKERLLYRDLDVDSPYNTYRRYGLPPGPIGNPGAEAIRAALFPAPDPVLYFVADDGGGHRFSVTYGEHLRNVRERNRRLHRKPPSR